MLTVKNINQYYGGSHILRDVSMESNLGKVTVLLGRNGVGKTTLLKSLMGLVPIKTGTIEFDGKQIQASVFLKGKTEVFLAKTCGRSLLAKNRRFSTKETMQIDRMHRLCNHYARETPIPFFQTYNCAPPDATVKEFEVSNCAPKPRV